MTEPLPLTLNPHCPDPGEWFFAEPCAKHGGHRVIRQSHGGAIIAVVLDDADGPMIAALPLFMAACSRLLDASGASCDDVEKFLDEAMKLAEAGMKMANERSGR